MSANKHYDRSKHRKWRGMVIRRANGLCEECARYGRTDRHGLPVAATTAHHIHPIDQHPDLAYDLDNGQALCAACHNRKHPEKGGRYW